MDKIQKKDDEEKFFMSFKSPIEDYDKTTTNQSIEENVKQIFIHTDQNYYYDSKIIYGILNKEKKETIIEKIRLLVEYFSDDIEKHSFVIGQTLKNKITDTSYEFYKYVKQKINQQKIIGFYAIVIPVYFEILKQEIDNDFFDYSFLKITLNRLKLRQKKIRTFFQYFHQFSQNSFMDTDEKKTKLREKTLDFFYQILKIYTTSQKVKQIYSKAQKLLDKLFDLDKFQFFILKNKTKTFSFVICFVLVKYFLDSELVGTDFFNFMNQNFNRIRKDQNTQQQYKYELNLEILKTINYHTFTDKFKQLTQFLKNELTSLMDQNDMQQKIQKVKPELIAKYLFLKEQEKNFTKVWSKNLRFLFNMIFIVSKLKFKKQIIDLYHKIF